MVVLEVQEYSMGEHARFSPSGIARVLQCSGSTTLPKRKQLDTTAADHGTKAHGLCEKLVLGKVYTQEDYTWDGKEDLEMLACAKGYKKYIDSLGTLDASHVEYRLKYSDDLWGTSDFIGIIGTTLYVVDYKQGYAPVPADADQLKTYAFMAYKEFAPQYVIDKIVTAIYQPRIREEAAEVEHTVESIRKFATKVNVALDKIREGEVQFTAGSHCQYCNKLECPEIKRIKNDIGTSPAVMSTDDLARVLRELDGLEHYIKEVRTYAYAQAMDGVRIPNYKMVRKVTHRKWSSDVDEDALTQYISLDNLYAPRKMITPTQALKLSEHIPNNFIVKPEGGLALVVSTDPRKEELSDGDMERMLEVMALNI